MKKAKVMYRPKHVFALGIRILLVLLSALGASLIGTSAPLRAATPQVDKIVFLPAIVSVSETNLALYPVQPGTKEWAQFQTHDEMVAATRIPAHKLATMTTLQLLEAVVTHPLLSDMLAFNNLRQGYDELESRVDALAELRKRPDSAEIAARILNDELTRPKSFALSRMGVDDGESAKSSRNAPFAEYGKTTLKISFLHLFLAHSMDAGMANAATVGHLATKSNGAEARPFSSVHTSADFAGTSIVVKVLDSSIVEEARNEFQSALSRQAAPNADSRNTCATRTPRGSCVAAWSRDELSWFDIQSLNLQAKLSYPNATRGSDASRKYNCHSYAWYWQSTSNNLWINDTVVSGESGDGMRTYWRDNSYFQTYGAATKIWYEHGDHSAIFYDATRYRSKWGMLPQMVHAPKYSPYNATSLKFFAKS